MRVVVADDSLIVRAGLTRLIADLGHQVVAEADRATTLPAIVTANDPDLAVVDIRMPPHNGNDGLVAAAEIRAANPKVAILVLSQYVVPGYLSWLLKRNPNRIGYLLKDRLLTVGMLDDALTRLSAGQTVVDPDLVQLLMRSGRGSTTAEQLSARERDVLELMAQGMSDRGIASKLFVSLNTVGTHVQHIFAKLEIPDGASENRRVLAVLRWLADTQPKA